MAIKVVGVGSVGTVCSIALLMASEKDPLFLQVKEARPSVLEAYAGKSLYANHGQRVVVGHRLMQSASDIFLGWTQGKDGRHFYVRQLRDVKIKFAVEEFGPAKMLQFADWCGGHAGARPRPLRRARRDQRLPRQERRVRSSHRGLRRRLCRSVRARPRSPDEGRARRETGGAARKANHLGRSSATSSSALALGAATVSGRTAFQ